MKVQIIEKECIARVGLSIELSNSECSSIERVADKLNQAVENAIGKAKATVKGQKSRYMQTTDVPVSINLEMATRISWILGHLVHKTESGLFTDADNMASASLAVINSENDEFNEGD